MLWNDFEINENSTAMTFLIKSFDGINENENYYDKNILQTIRDFKSIVGENGKLSIKSNDNIRESIIIGREYMEKVDSIIEKIRPSQVEIFSGVLDTIKHSKNMFVLQILKNNRKIHGYVDTNFLEPESLRKYWGKKITIKGKAHYSLSGKIQMLEATAIKNYEEGEEILGYSSDLIDLSKSKNNKKDNKQFPWEYWPEDDNTTLDEYLKSID